MRRIGRVDTINLIDYAPPSTGKAIRMSFRTKLLKKLILDRRPYYGRRLLKKLFLDRRPFCGRSEFSFQLRPGGQKWRKIHITAREGTFRRTVFLRRGTSDLNSFEQVFTDNHYNLRRLPRWDEICQRYNNITTTTKTPLILDLGANVGLASLYFTKNWPEAWIIAVEPSKENYHVLCQNIAGYSNVQPIMAAIASEDGAVNIANPDAEEWMYRTVIASAGSVDTIPALSVQSLLQMATSARRYCPFMIKIDIEGSEQDLFSKNVDWITLFPVIIVELHDWLLPRAGVSKNFLHAIAQHDRDFLFDGENVFSIANDLAA
jgi:FkbM family methyltransferase